MNENIVPRGSNSVGGKRPKWLIPVIISGVSLFVIAAVLISVFFIFPTSVNPRYKTVNSVTSQKRNHSMNEIMVAQSNSFQKLNNLEYPNNNKPTKTQLFEEEQLAYQSFADQTYSSLVKTSKKNNMSYSVVGLYSVLNELAEASSRESLTAQFDELFGLEDYQRMPFYQKVMSANSFASSDNTTQLKNAAFFNNKYRYSQDYINQLTNLYCEAYQMSFATDLNKIVEWANQALNSDNFIDLSYLECNEYTQLYHLSTLYFKNNWQSKYVAENNIEKDFYLTPEQTVKATFMRHQFYTNCYYDYDSYISFADTYQYGYASITYLVPKKIEDDIFELTKGVNIFEDKEENIVRNEYGDIMVDLTTPKFKTKTDMDFQSCLVDLGFGDVYNEHINSFGNAFTGPETADVNFFLKKLKQRNEVEFNEDGTIVKSLTLAQTDGKSMSAAPGNGDTLVVKLNQPFIYIIKDINGIPIFVGHIDNPTLR